MNATKKVKRVVLEILRQGPLTRDEILDKARRASFFLSVKNKVALSKIDAAIGKLISEGLVENGHLKTVIRANGGIVEDPCYRLRPVQAELNLPATPKVNPQKGVKKGPNKVRKGDRLATVLRALREAAPETLTATEVRERVGFPIDSRGNSPVHSALRRLVEKGMVTVVSDEDEGIKKNRMYTIAPEAATVKASGEPIETSKKPAPSSMVIDGMEYISIREHNKRILDRVLGETSQLSKEVLALNAQISALQTSRTANTDPGGIEAEIRRVSTMETVNGKFVMIDFADFDHDFKPGQRVTIRRQENGNI